MHRDHRAGTRHRTTGGAHATSTALSHEIAAFPGFLARAAEDPQLIGEAALDELQHTAGNRAVADRLSMPAAQRQRAAVPVQRDARKGPGHRDGEAWDYGPITKRKSVNHDLATYIGWVKDVERGYGPDKQMVLQRLRRLHYSSYSGKAGAKFDKIIAEQAGAGGEPLTVLKAPAAAVDGLFETDEVTTPDGKTVDLGHVLAALDLKTSGSTWKADMGDIAAGGAPMLNVVTWAGDLASWWLEWVQQVKKLYAAGQTGPPDPAADSTLLETVGRSKASKEDLLGDMDAVVLAASSTRRSTYESVKREGREIRHKNVDTELTAPVSKLLEDYYGTDRAAATSAPVKSRFAAFVQSSSPRIPYQEGEEGNRRWVKLDPSAVDLIRDAVENVAWIFVSQGTSWDWTDTKTRFGWRFGSIARHFAKFLEEGLRTGDAKWL